MLTGSVFAINANNNMRSPTGAVVQHRRQGHLPAGTFPKTLSFPLTVTFGEASVFGSLDPIPVSSLGLNFPAKTSAVKATNCSNLGAVTGTATDEVAGLALAFGDTSDGLTSPTGTPSAVNVAGANTVVTDLCPATVSKASITGIKKGTRGRPWPQGQRRYAVHLRVAHAPEGPLSQGTEEQGPEGLGRQAQERQRQGHQGHGQLQVQDQAATVDFIKGVFATSKLKKAVTRHKTKSLIIKYTTKYAPATAAAANSTVFSVTVKHIS